MEKDLKILEHEDKTSKNGKNYTRFKTQEGWMSCFEDDIIEKLKKVKGETVKVIVAESGDFKNIRKIVEDTKAENSTKEKENTVTKENMMMTSYAKDIFIELMSQDVLDKNKPRSETMKKAINLVKQAKKELMSDC